MSPWEKPSLVVRLEEGEKVLEESNGAYSGPSTMNSKLSGTLMITNRRVIFLQKRGRLQPSFHCRLQLRLENVKEITMQGFMSKKAVLLDNLGRRHELYVSHAESMVSNITTLREKRVRELDKPRKGEIEEFRLDFSDLQNLLKKGGVLVASISCPFCQSPLDVTNSGEYAKCKSCGRLIDVKKVLELLNFGDA